VPAVIERNVDPKDIIGPEHRTIESFRADAKYVAEHEEQLLKDYADQWIAVYEGEVVAHGKNTRELMKQLRERGLRGRSPLLKHMNTAEMTLIL
jgi:uncharacterized protein DUF5678